MKKTAERKLDIFPHIFPPAFFERMKAIAAEKPALAANIKRWLHIPVLWDLERRVKMMRRWPGYQQVLTLPLPAIEFLADERESPALARLANSERYLACELNGRRFDIGVKYGLLIAQLALALAGKDRDEVLSGLVELLAVKAPALQPASSA